VWCNLARLGLLKYFDAICGGNEVEAVKPDPSLYRMALAELDVHPDESIVFEDSPNGIIAAQNAGFFVSPFLTLSLCSLELTMRIWLSTPWQKLTVIN
jgi:beta-phosphoglucomutase-like phosphatase (HAD superfamily)